MYLVPMLNPYRNLAICNNMMCKIKEYRCNGWAIGQLYPNGGPDEFTYFFSIRNIPISNYLRGNISMGEPSAYCENMIELQTYINWAALYEIELIDEQISLIYEYKSKNWAIGELYPDGGPDEFVVFFSLRNLTIYPYLRGTVDIGCPSAYDNNIEILMEYRKIVSYFIVY